ncbi:homeobox protein cut-like protein isoform 2 [Galdieria sulphuraria]|uniref:Protein CASP n=1 Tax=Galdieria sulphuraria TaxID=130081 RepID=M2WWM9_GALSU|nr:homeobox protein cut-like protein isoform 2 [Galdieria sulphuraria]EME28405.1 homeobox protein cut-like protein isoform 2 [Galdieria sulphuraria]|eukprot:XP_005704925.1 homeobox protein cut-like protein isoform 2 [Galdieria sulphuraria]
MEEMTDTMWLQNQNETLATPTQIWKQINYDQFKEQLEKMSMDMVEKQKESKATRKRLTETTKEFKHSSSEEKAKNLNTLLKSYQSEIDRLTTRAAFAESCFFQVYQKLYATTDPCVFIAELEDWKWKYQQVLEEKKQMQQELDQFHLETADVQRQDATVRELLKQLKQKEEDTERKVIKCYENLAEKSKQLEAEWTETLKNTKAHQENQQSIWTHEIEQYKEKLANLQTAYESVQNRLFQTSHQLEELRGVKNTEHQILLQELEQSREENRDLNRKISELLHSKSSNVLSSEASESKDFYANLAWKDGKIKQLEKQLDALKSQMEEYQISYRQELEDKQQVITKQEMQIKQLERRLEAAPNLDEVQRLRKQITNLQALQFDHVEQLQEEASGKEPTDLETLLMEKNRSLEDQLSKWRVTVQNIEKESMQYQQQALSLEEALSDQKEVNRKLEQALNEALKVRNPLGVSVSLENSSNASKPRIPEEQGILDIVCQQRDRYKHKMLEYEDQVDKMRERISLLNATVETLRNESKRTSYQVVDSSVSDKRGTKMADKESLSLMLEQGNSNTLAWPETTSYAGASRRWLRQRRSFERQEF